MPDGTPLYVHVPFCEKKCHYCDFYSLPAEGLDLEGTVDAILAEARRRAPRAPRTVFLGGGTPSLLSIASLQRLLDGLEELTGFRASSRETTVECNPESLDLDKAKALVDLGVDRLSIGFQSLEPETLALFGRVHDVEQSFRAYDAARAAGVPAVNVDVIFAAPGHDARTWSEALARVLALEPDHLSAYNLAFEEDTVFRRWLESGRIQRHSDARELELLAITLEQTRAAGLARYEISNYARPGHECLHNVNYWENGPYLGLGPSAVSHVDGVRAGNTKVLQRYVERARAAGEAREWSEALEPAQRLGETWWLGLRTLRGVDPRAARAVARFDAGDDPCEARARGFAEEGLLLERDGRFALTERGLQVADAVAAEFLQ